ncbi:MAG: LLM class flavin-dependent oxidoreductase [Candidatus Thorarchaeota archaeon]
MEYKASIGITTNMKVSSTNWIAENAASLSASSIWIGEDIGIGQDPFVLASSTILKAQQVRVGTGIVPITMHNISTIARAALTLHEISEGNFVLGIGIGGIQDLTRLGFSVRKPVTATKEAISILRQLWNGESVTIDSELFKIVDYNLRLNKAFKVPIFLGVRGPQMLKLAGRLADGVILSGPLDYLKYAMKIIDDSAISVGRNPKEIERVAWSATIPTFHGGKEKLAKRVVSIVIADTPEIMLDMINIDREKLGRIKEAVSESGPDAGIPFIDDEIRDMFAISGNKEHMVDMFESIIKLGASEVVLGPPFSGDWRNAMKDIFHEINSRRQQ